MIKRSLCIKAALCALVFAAPGLFAQMPQPFSADYSSTSTAENEKTTGKVYFSAPRMRVDVTSTTEDEGMGHISVIVDGATQTSYVLMPQRRMYMEIRQGDQNIMMPDLNVMMPALSDLQRLRNPESTDPCSGRKDATCKKLGAETVNGRSCDKWEVTDKESGKSTMWIDQKLHFPMKIKDAEGSVVEFTNIQEGPQNASLFTLPAGYKPLSLFGGERRH